MDELCNCMSNYFVKTLAHGKKSSQATNQNHCKCKASEFTNRMDIFFIVKLT